MKKICLNCKKDFKTWDKRSKYCCRACFSSTPRPLAVRLKIAQSCKERGIGKWMEGRERPIELRLRHSKKMKEWVASGTHNFWKGGIAEITRSFKANFQNTVEYRLWRTAIFKRDNYTCQGCGARNGNGKKIELNADHIKSFAQFPELRLAIDNGRTLCRECHYKRHSNAGLSPDVIQKTQ